ncbi:hypothetical protein [Frigoribacterium faeni]|uniref:Exo-alpha-sialidase n=1 Tax=Frigoribacterium faeni TaxID=145483 RepID=A0A7W3JJR7_9MICO|nr:hypothetical protein [Frigoribacterium faeni]MBA8814172.1 hypothetical protein [Frigoribacterium faeni]BFF16224.1 hypothetical protein GCM10025699_75270 [Microbacterium flavescens]GEK84141.1 hypothetical protein FFA01_24500 [Frigoribacterium faeni]
MAQDRARKRGRRNNRPVIIGAIALFVVVDVALVGYAILNTDSASDSSFAETPVREDNNTPSAEPTPTQTAREPLAAPATYLSAVDATTAYRTQAGDCGSATTAVLEKTSDGGATWTSSTLTTDLSSVFRLQAQDSTYAFMVGGATSTCEVGFTATYTSGTGFQTYPDRVAATWYADPATPGVVHSPAGSFASPCGVVTGLAPSTDLSAAVLCDDRTIYRTGDGARAWDSGTSVSGAVALTQTSNGYLVASTDDAAACVGVSVASLGYTGDATPIGCIAGVDTADAPQVLLSAGATSVWAQVGNDVAVSADGGVTWPARG